ncbi:PAS domain-containing protein [Jannaschia sp. LMIT008]|uniref:PAS domain-containing protein n=1 Tax=Jannaschia maritima TaxID=3032585 RepID=UPI0028120CA2|nr:PAS domain-containing protein [Jannaschia sp. LMIT008]
MSDDRDGADGSEDMQDDEAPRQSDQAYRAFGRSRDESGDRFRAVHSSDAFDGASGVLFEQAMAQTRMAICLSDPRKDDHPIVFANRAFRDLTGYDEDEIVGRNCRFLQGPDSDAGTIRRISEALDAEEVIVVELLNYRKDGTPFWNALHLGPIYDPDGNLIYFFGSQWDVTDVHAARADEKHAKLMSRELSHRMKNMFAVIGGIVTFTGRSRGAVPLAHEINERIQALGRAYETTLDDAQRGSIDVGEAVRSVLRPYDPDGTRIWVEVDGIRSAPNTVSSLGLTLHELATNAVKHGSLSHDVGTVVVTAETGNDGDASGAPSLRLRWRERGGPSVTPPDGTHGTGMGIIDTLLRAAGGSLTRDWSADGLTATIELPGDAR